MIKFLIGGSPRTHWSIAQSKARETEPEGIGWELFKNYLIAKEKFCPDFFLYENNRSAAQAIRTRISEELEVPLQYINSALVSAQNRWRFYAHNIPGVPQPEDRRIMLTDILESVTGEPPVPLNMTTGEKAQCLRETCYKDGIRNLVCNTVDWRTCVAERVFPIGTTTDGKAYCVTASYAKGSNIGQTIGHRQRTLVAERVDAYAGRVVGRRINEQGRREDYNESLPHIQRFEVNGNPQKTNTISTVEKDNMIAVRTDGAVDGFKVYEVAGGKITYNGVHYEIALPDGFYIIRKLTVTECCRLQTLPDDYCRVAKKTNAYKGLGNGWTAEVIIHILSYALAGVPKDEEIVVLSMYDGIGTGRYCFEKLGFKNIRYYAYEIEKPAMEIAGSNFPDIVQCGDAFQVRESGWALPEEADDLSSAPEEIRNKILENHQRLIDQQKAVGA